jgi:hypothetical protein
MGLSERSYTMAVLEHISGEQLSNTRLKAQLNFLDAEAGHVALTGIVELEVIRSGMGLVQFRDACQKNFQAINALLPFTPKRNIASGDMLWDVRDKLNINFASIDTEA